MSSSSPTHTYSKFTTSRSLTYSYVHIPPPLFQPNRQYILFLHGFPSSSHDWRFQISYFSKKGYGVIVPDLLGYGESSKPLDVKFYSGKGMAGDVWEVLKHERVERVVGVGHDWGSYLLSRMVTYYPGMFERLVFVDIGYSPPGNNLTEQTIRYINGMVKQNMGFEVFGYFLFFMEDGAVTLLNENGDGVQALFHTSDEEVGKRYMGAEGGMRDWLEERRGVLLPEYFTTEEQEYNRKLFSPENGGYGAAINWYLAQLHNINAEDDKNIPEKYRILQQPTLLLTGKNWITATADFPNQMKASTKDLTVETLDAGHWIMLERAEETNAAIEKFLE